MQDAAIVTVYDAGSLPAVFEKTPIAAPPPVSAVQPDGVSGATPVPDSLPPMTAMTRKSPAE